MIFFLSIVLLVGLLLFGAGMVVLWVWSLREPTAEVLRGWLAIFAWSFPILFAIVLLGLGFPHTPILPLTDEAFHRAYVAVVCTLGLGLTRVLIRFLLRRWAVELPRTAEKALMGAALVLWLGVVVQTVFLVPLPFADLVVAVTLLSGAAVLVDALLRRGFSLHPLVDPSLGWLLVPAAAGGLLALLALAQLLGLPLTGGTEIRALRLVLWAVFAGFAGAWALLLGQKLLRTPPSTLVPEGVTEAFSTRHELSKRESEVLVLLVSGLGLKEIGLRLGISLNTVRNHNASILRKARVSTRLQLIHLVLHARAPVVLSD